MEYTIIDESDHFFVGIGTMPRAKLPEYVVINKEYGVVEYNNSILYFVKEWVRQMEEALDSLGEKPGFPPPAQDRPN